MNPNNRRQPQPMPGLSKRAQALLAPRKGQIVIGPSGSVIPQAKRSTKELVVVDSAVTIPPTP